MGDEYRAPVLVVDDDADIREALRLSLADEGHTVAEACDGTSALAYLRANPPPAGILLDWNMAPMNAPEFMREFAREPSFRAIPVLLLTADIRAADKATMDGITGYLAKPVDLDALCEWVDRYCR